MPENHHHTAGALLAFHRKCFSYFHCSYPPDLYPYVGIMERVNTTGDAIIAAFPGKGNILP